MATAAVEVNNATYTKIDSGTETALFIWNAGEEPCRVILTTGTPAAGASGFVVLHPGEGIWRNGVSGDFYARIDSASLSAMDVVRGE